MPTVQRLVPRPRARVSSPGTPRTCDRPRRLGPLLTAGLWAWALALAPAAAPAAEPQPVELARQTLRARLADPRQRPAVLGALGTTEDANLLPLFDAAARWGRPATARFAVSVLAQTPGDRARELLRERVSQADDPAIAAHALGQLLEAEAVDAEFLRPLLKSDSEAIRLLAARGLVRAGQTDGVAEVLKGLAGSDEQATELMARLTLLKLGAEEQRAVIDKKIAGDASAGLKSLLLGQVAVEKIAAAAPLALRIAQDPNNPFSLQVVAWRAVATADPRGKDRLFRAIVDSEGLLERLGLTRVMALAEDNQRYLEALKADEGVAGALARLELARPEGGQPLSESAVACLDYSHPVVVGHLLTRAREDVDANVARGAAYVPALAKLLHAANRESRKASYAGQAASLLADIGTRSSLTELHKALTGGNQQVQRAALAGLTATRNAVAPRLAKPLLESPYAELYATAALALGRAGESAAQPRLLEILRHPGRFPPHICPLAGWYLLKLQGADAAAEARKLGSVLSEKP